MKSFKFAAMMVALLASVVTSLPAQSGGRSHAAHASSARSFSHSRSYSTHGSHGNYGSSYRSGARVGVAVGVPAYRYYSPPVYYSPPGYYAPGYYDPGYYYPEPGVVASPPVYIERDYAQAPAVPAPSNWWYFCAATQSYFPHVQQCAGGWQRVAPQPPPPPPG